MSNSIAAEPCNGAKKDRRLDLKVGFTCNNNCLFCAAADKRRMGEKSTEKIKSDLYEARCEGLKEVVFTGGEPTVRPDIVELVSYATDLGYENIQIQSNGRMFAYKQFCEEMIEAGANEFSMSLHGPRAEIHDFLTQSPGSFEQTVQGIKNLKKLNQLVITNSVATKSNYIHLPELAHLLVNLGVNQFQMAFVHAVGNAYKNFDNIVPRKSLTAPYIQRALQIGIDAGINVMVEDMPYCFMQGYEKYLGEIHSPPTEIRDIDSIDPKFEETRVKEGKCKGEKCKKCSYYSVCEGPWKEYPAKRGWDEFIPVEHKLPTSQQTPEDEESMLKKADELFLKGDVSQSLACYKKVLDKYPYNACALSNIAELCDFKLFEENKNIFQEFVALCSRALERDPHNAGALSLMAKIYKIKEDYKRAIQYYSKLCAADPTNWRVWGYLGIAYRNSGDIDVGNNIIFNFRLYQKLFSDDWKDIYDYRLKNLLTIIRTPGDLDKILKTEPKFKVLSFRIGGSLLNKKTGRKIIKFLGTLHSNDIVFRVSRPLPRCLFSESEYQKLINLYNMPKDCSECLELLLIDNEDIELCNGTKTKLGKKIVKDEVYRNLEMTNKKLNQKCKECLYNLRGNCRLLCLMRS